MMKSPMHGSNTFEGRSPGGQARRPGEPTATPTAQGADDAAIAAPDRPCVSDLILAVLMRTSRPCSPQEIMEVIAGAGYEPPDRLQLTQDIAAELRATNPSRACAVVELQTGCDDRWRLSPAFTAWLMSRSLPSLQVFAPGIPLQIANDG